MKSLKNFTLKITALSFLLMQSIAAKEIKIRVTAIDASRPGNIMAMVLGPDGFPIEHDRALEVQNKTADAEEITFTFAVTQERFAIKILHDENEDGKTTKNWTGIIPAEGLGFSNGTKLTWRGPPKFRRAFLKLEEVNDEIIIPVIYPGSKN